MHQEAEKPYDKNVWDEDQIENLEVCQTWATVTHEEYRWVENSIHFGGIGKPDEHGCTHYGVSLTPLNEIANLPVRINPELFQYNNHQEVGRWPECVTMLEFLDAIYDDLSFHG